MTIDYGSNIILRYKMKFFPLYGRKYVKNRCFFLAVLKRLWSSDIIFGSVEVIADIVLSINWTADYDSDNIL